MLPPDWCNNQKVRITHKQRRDGKEGWICGVAFISGKKGPVKYLIQFREMKVRYIHQDHIKRIDKFKDEETN